MLELFFFVGLPLIVGTFCGLLIGLLGNGPEEEYRGWK